MEILDKILNSKLLNYEKLNELLFPFIKKYKKESVVNIYIDVWDWVKQLYNPDITENLNSLVNNEKYTIASHLINIVSHYRHYFASRHQMYTTFYFIVSTNKCKELTNKFSEYKKDFYEKRLNINNQYFGVLNSIMKTNFEICKIYIEYIPHAYWIDTNNLDPRGMLHCILELNNKLDNIGEIQKIKNGGSLNIILSNDDLLLQSLLLPNIINIQSRSEKSRILYKDNIISTLLEGSKKTNTTNLLPEYITLINPLMSFKNYNIKGLRNMGGIKAVKFIEKAVENNIINLDSNPLIDKNSMIQMFKDEEEFNKYLLNFELINNEIIYSTNYKFYNSLLNILLIDRVNPLEIRKVNEVYFNKEPVLLEYCFEGEEY